MKLNCKGFMLAEVVVVSVIICTVLVTLYTSLVRINNAYDTRNRYYDINTLYFTEEVNDILIYMGYINEYISTSESKEVNLNNVFSMILIFIQHTTLILLWGEVLKCISHFMMLIALVHLQI